MKKLSKPATLALVAAGASIIALGGAAGVSAATSTNGTDGSPESSLVDKLVAKFNLNKADVQSVFDEERKERQAEHQQRMEERLTQAVTDGKITEDQKSKILAKQQEMQTFMDSLRDKTYDERRTAMDSKRTELEQWAKDNNIPTEYLRFAMGGPGGRGHGHGPGGMMRGMQDDGAANSSSTNGSASTDATTES